MARITVFHTSDLHNKLTPELADKLRDLKREHPGSLMLDSGDAIWAGNIFWRPGGEPVFPVGLPHCRRDALVFESGTLRCERCHDDLAVICPMCSLGRSALIDTCTNCGLVLKVVPRAVVVRTTPGPKPGGAAVA